MTDAVSFADVLFLLLVCIVTGGILTWVNRGRSGDPKSDSEDVEQMNIESEDASPSVDKEDS